MTKKFPKINVKFYSNVITYNQTNKYVLLLYYNIFYL